MRISRLLAGAALVALAACEPGITGLGPDRVAVSVADQPVTVAAPPGFCVDPDSTVVTESGAFVLVSDCDLLGIGQGGASQVGAVMTASISADPMLIAEGSDTTLDDLEAFLATPQGRAVLGRSGQADGTRIIQTMNRNDVLYVLVEDRGRQPVPGVEARFWRAFLDVSGRMAALSIQGFEGAGPGPEAGLRHLVGFAESIRRANAG